MRRIPLAPAFLLAALTLGIAAAAHAQPNALEVSPFAGYRWGGRLAGDNGLFDHAVDVDESVAYGVRLDFVVGRMMQVELLAERQPTRFTHGDRLFGRDDHLPDVDIDSLQAGLLFQTGDGQVHPYGVFGLGPTRLRPHVDGVDSVSRLSVSGGGGVKLMLNPHVGARLEARALWVDTNRSRDSRDRSSRDRSSGDDLVQGEATAGLIFAF